MKFVSACCQKSAGSSISRKSSANFHGSNDICQYLHCYRVATLPEIRSLEIIRYLQRDLYQRETGCVNKISDRERLCKNTYTISMLRKIIL